MKTAVTALLILLFFTAHAQKVGVVLSGGGAAGIAHVGFLKVLEENDIPIDYIAGTSAGAIIAGLYASGYSPEEIESLLTSEEFIKMATGTYEDGSIYYFKQDDPNASWLNFKISLTGKVSDLIPTNIINPTVLDFNYMRLMAQAEARANYNFDSLFIPFRCVAADVQNNKEVIFKSGHLTEAVRASSTYPFYIKPIKVNDQLLFDGGIYNNFPSDVLYDNFYPDIILGCNVAGNPSAPNEDDLLSQLEALIIEKTDYIIPCENGIIVEPKVGDIGTFSFSRAQESVNIGTQATKEKIDLIKATISKRVTKSEMQYRRQKFKMGFAPLEFKNVTLEGLNKWQSVYVKQSLLGYKKNPNINYLQKNYFKIFSDDKITFIYPTSRYNKASESFDLYLKIKKEKDFKVGIGGNFASRPVTTGMINVRYNYMGLLSASIEGNYYFGSFYNSAMLKTRIDVPFGLPFFFEPEISISKTDYFKTKSFEFEDEKPSFFIQYEKFARLNIGLPAGKRGKVRLGYTFGTLTDEYYQTKTYSKADTTDKTFFFFKSPYFLYERSTLNDKLYANKGTYTTFSARMVEGEERFLPGSTSYIRDIQSQNHKWFQARFYYENYYKGVGLLKLGLCTEIFYSTQELFMNYTSSILRARPFKPTTESNVLFLESFRANKFISFGHRFIFSFTSGLDLRLEGYVFQPIERIERNTLGQAQYGQNFDKRYFVGSANLVFKTPVGPISLSTNYYHNLPEVATEKTTPLTFFFHFGYVLFNRRALE